MSPWVNWSAVKRMKPLWFESSEFHLTGEIFSPDRTCCWQAKPHEVSAPRHRFQCISFAIQIGLRPSLSCQRVPAYCAAQFAIWVATVFCVSRSFNALCYVDDDDVRWPIKERLFGADKHTSHRYNITDVLPEIDTSFFFRVLEFFFSLDWLIARSALRDIYNTRNAHEAVFK